MNLQQLTDARSTPTAPGLPRVPNIKALTSIRIFAAVYVALSHFVRPFSHWGPLGGMMEAGYTGVSFFFILSGFILTYSHAQEYEAGRGRPTKFWVARFARIYPIYLVSMLFAAYVSRADFFPRVHLLAFLADLLLVQTWSVRMVAFFNVPAWSLSMEAFFYLVFPFLLLRLRPSSAKKAVLAIAGFWLLAIAAPLLCLVLYPNPSWSQYGQGPGALIVFWVRRFPFLASPQFLAGISLGWFYLRFPPSRATASVLAYTGTAGLLVTLLFAGHLPFVVLHNGLLLPLFAMIILGMCSPNGLSKLMSKSWLALLGEASFSFYLLHFLFNDWTRATFGAHGTIVSGILRILIILGISVLLHLGIERPCRRIILGWYRQRHARESDLQALPSRETLSSRSQHALHT